MKSRDYYLYIWNEFNKDKRMILISGVRQCGKTTLAKVIGTNQKSHLYFNYDLPDNKTTLLKNPYFFQDVNQITDYSPLIILDEIHKYKDWKNYLKGIYDGFYEDYRFLVTGSGRLDIFQKGGDSLAGRYWQFHLFPFTLGELGNNSPKNSIDINDLITIPELKKEHEDYWNNFFELSGFPEPFISGKKLFYNRWVNTFRKQLIHEDIRNTFAVKQIDTMESLYSLISNNVGSLFSCLNMANILKVSHNTINSWIHVFERFYLIFRIKPYSKRISRSILKEPKVYLFNYCEIKDPGARFENMIALELKRAVTIWTEYGLGKFDLYFIRNKEKQEVDFLITKDEQPLIMIEAKLNDTNISEHFKKIQGILNIPGIQLVNKSNVYKKIKNNGKIIIIISAARWLPVLS